MRKDQRGAAMVEFAIVFPVQLFVVLGLIQLALAFGASQVVLYSSYSAARSAIPDRKQDGSTTSEQAEQDAPVIAMLPVTWAPEFLEAKDREGFLGEITRFLPEYQKVNWEYQIDKANTEDPTTLSVATWKDEDQDGVADPPADRYQWGGTTWTTKVTHTYQLLIPGGSCLVSGGGGMFNLGPAEESTTAVVLTPMQGG